MGQAAISVVIPTFNRAHLIGATIESILQQTAPAAEIIVVDDGSTDDTAGALAPFGSRLEVIRRANSGDLASRNAGLARAQGALVAFCDSDDLWRPDHLARSLAAWERRPDLHFVFSNFAIVRDDVWQPGSKLDDAPEDFWAHAGRAGPDLRVFEVAAAREIIDFQPFFPSALVASREFFLGIGGWDESVERLVGCDSATAMMLVRHPPFGVQERATVGIRKHGGNFSGDTVRMNLGDAEILERLLARDRDLAPLRGAIEESIRQRRCAAIEAAFGLLDLQTARSVARRTDLGRSPARTRVKARIAALPPRVARPVARCVLALGQALRRTALPGRRTS